jgi:NADP-dependent 3-hydroxy acid dehydrogenase YdfG
LHSVAQEIEALGVKALPIACDVTDSEQVNILIEKALTEFGHIDLLINNAGICMTAPMEKTTLEDWQQILNVNLWGYIYPIHALLPHFLERKQGTSISYCGFRGDDGSDL